MVILQLQFYVSLNGNCIIRIFLLNSEEKALEIEIQAMIKWSSFNVSSNYTWLLLMLSWWLSNTGETDNKGKGKRLQ